MATKPDFKQKHDLDALIVLAGKTNLAEHFTDERLHEIGKICWRGYEIDCASIVEWRQEVDAIRKFSETSHETKTTPWPDASNVRYPLIISSAWQFNARAYPAIVNLGAPVLAKVQGDDPDGQKQARADRISQHMSWQLIEEMDEWDEDMDRLLLTLPMDGCAFKKVYYDPALGRNVSELVMATDLVVNANTLTLKTCPRISQRFSLYPYEVIERINNETFIDEDYGLEEGDEANMEPIEFIEQHTYIDTDGDGYPEPYIVTFTEDEGKVARIRANFVPQNIVVNETGEILKITPTRFFVKYECFPDPSGCFYGKGFGSLLRPLNDSVDSIINQLIDAGKLANTGGGFIANSFRLDSGSMQFSPGKWEKVDTAGFPMKDAIMPLPVPDPSPVLFTLLGMLIEAANEIGSTQDIMTGGSPGANTPATTTLAIIEQGMKVYTAIFKRIYRAMKEELDMLYALNSRFVEAGVYQTFLDNEKAIAIDDYSMDDLDVTPAADPTSATDIQKAAKAQVLMQFYGQPTANNPQIQIDSMRAAGIADPEKYLAPPPEGPSPEEIEFQAEMELELKKLAIEERKLDMERMKAAVGALDTIAGAMEKMAKTDELGADNILNIRELLLLADLIRGSINDTIQVGNGIPAVEGNQPVALGPPGQVPGPVGPAGQPPGSINGGLQG